MTMKKETWREQRIRIKAQTMETVYFHDTQPNYIYLSNPTGSTLYAGVNGNVSPQTYDAAISPYGADLLPSMLPVTRVHLFNNSEVDADFVIKSWVGDFDPNALPRTQSMGGVGGDGLLGIVEVNNLLSPLPTGTNVIGGVVVTGWGESLPLGTNRIGSVAIHESAYHAANSLIISGTSGQLKDVTLHGAIVFKVVSDNGEVQLFDGTSPAWKKGEFDSPTGLLCEDGIRLDFAANDTAYVLFKEV